MSDFGIPIVNLGRDRPTGIRGTRGVRQTKHREITSKFLLTMNTNKTRDTIPLGDGQRMDVETALGSLATQLFDEEGLEQAWREDVFKNPMRELNGPRPETLENMYDTGPGGVQVDPDNFDEALKNHLSAESRYGIETGDRFHRKHMHMLLTTKTKVPVQIDRANLKRFVNSRFRELTGFEGDIFSYVNIRWVPSPDMPENYIAKSNRPHRVTATDELIDSLTEQTAQIRL